LLNSITPTLATLSELRRYAHTLGVLHLFDVWRRASGRRFDRKAVDALEVAIILHDVATPPFGHLFEYVLKESLGWDHESAAVPTLLKEFGSSSSAQAIYRRRTPKVLDHVERLGIDLETVTAILGKSHDLSPLIMGVVDFDNLDNVWRMSWALGVQTGGDRASAAEELAGELDIAPNGKLRLSEKAVSLLAQWATLRRAAYDVLVFDQSTVASQALLTHAIRRGLSLGVISADDWVLTDEALLAKLSTDPDLAKVIDRQYLGQLPPPIISVQLCWSDAEFFRRERGVIEASLVKAIKEGADVSAWVYAFKERGSFEKQVGFVDSSGAGHQFGTTSRSLVLSAFSDRELSAKQLRLAAASVLQFLRDEGIEPTDVSNTIVGSAEPITNRIAQ
jgi:hypothetical protein